MWGYINVPLLLLLLSYAVGVSDLVCTAIDQMYLDRLPIYAVNAKRLTECLLLCAIEANCVSSPHLVATFIGRWTLDRKVPGSIPVCVARCGHIPV